MINALSLTKNRVCYKKELCDKILAEIELGIVTNHSFNVYRFVSKEYPRYIKGIRGCRSSRGNIITDLSVDDIQYIREVLTKANFKVTDIQYKDTATIKWDIDWREVSTNNDI